MAAAVGAGAKARIKVAAICGSLLEDSCTRGLIRSAIEISKSSIPGVEIEHVEIAELPLLNTDLEGEGRFPPVVEAFRQKILEADSILFASPEYKSVAAPLKNALDWASRPPNVWADKAAAIISAFGGSSRSGSQYRLRHIGVFLDLHFINKPEFLLKAFEPPAKYDQNYNLIDAQARESLKQVLLSLQAFTLRHQGR
ncbi:hypothetical protein ACE6H2_006320 [Prunus campanulata]